jgi:hypothetical protein
MSRLANDFVPGEFKVGASKLSTGALKQCVQDCTNEACMIDAEIVRIMGDGVDKDAPSIRLLYAVQEQSWQIAGACYEELQKRVGESS